MNEGAVTSDEDVLPGETLRDMYSFLELENDGPATQKCPGGVEGAIAAAEDRRPALLSASIDGDALDKIAQAARQGRLLSFDWGKESMQALRHIREKQVSIFRQHMKSDVFDSVEQCNEALSAKKTLLKIQEGHAKKEKDMDMISQDLECLAMDILKMNESKETCLRMLDPVEEKDSSVPSDAKPKRIVLRHVLDHFVEERKKSQSKSQIQQEAAKSKLRKAGSEASILPQPRAPTTSSRV